MTRRQINLYDPRLRRQQDWLTLPYLLLMTLVLGAASLLAGSWVRWEVPEMRERLRQGAAELEDLRRQEAALKARLAANQPDPRLLQAIAEKKRRLAFLEEVFARAEEQLQHAQVSPVELLTALARQTSEGVWLTALEFDPESGHVALYGRVRSAALLPDYIKRLENEPVFRGRRFVAFEIRSGRPAVESARSSGDGDSTGASRTPWLEFALLPKPVSERDRQIEGG